MPTLQQLFRRKPVPEMSEETGADTGRSELARTIGLFQLSMFGVGATIGTGIFFVLSRGRAGRRSRGDRVVRDRRRGRRAHRGLLRRAGQRRPGVGVVVLLRLRDARRAAGRRCRRLPAAGVRRVRRGRRRRLVAVPERACSTTCSASGFRKACRRRPSRAGCSTCPRSSWSCLCALLLIRGASESAKTNAVMVLIKIGVLVLFVVIGVMGWNADNLVALRAVRLRRHHRGGRHHLLLLHRSGRRLDRRRGGEEPPPDNAARDLDRARHGHHPVHPGRRRRGGRPAVHRVRGPGGRAGRNPGEGRRRDRGRPPYSPRAR